MNRSNDPRYDPDESPPTDDRDAGFTTEDAYVLYDRENVAAWIASDTTHDAEEMV